MATHSSILAWESPWTEEPGGLQSMGSQRVRHAWATNIHTDKLEEVGISSVQSLSGVQLFVTPWTAAHQASLSITNSWSLLKFMSIESVMPSSYLTLFHPLLLPPSIFPSIRVFSSESVLCIRWPKYGASASASGLPMNIQDWFPLRLTGLISLQSRGLSRVFSKTQFKSINSPLHSAFFVVQLSHLYMTTEKNHSFD